MRGSATAVLGLLASSISLAACDSSDPADATADAARDILKDKTLRCGIIGVMADCPPPNERTNASACILTGTGFAGVDPLDTRTLNAVADAPWGSYVGPLPTESVLGVTAFALQHVADQTGLNVEFYASRIPPAVLNNADSTQPYMYMLYDQGFDCAAYAVTFMYERAQFMRYSAPYLPYGFLAVTGRPALAPVKYTDIMWTVYMPFTPNCWGVVVASVAFSGLFHAFLDSLGKSKGDALGDDEDAESPGSEKGRGKHGGAGEGGAGKEAGEEAELKEEENEVMHTTMGRCGVSIFQSTVSVSAHGFFSYHTPAASIYAWVKAVCYFLLLAIYSANLAAYFTLAPQTTQPITDIQDFITLGVPACIGNRSNHIKFFQTFYPQIQLIILPNWQAALDAVNAGKCIGAVGSNFDLLDGMGPDNDPNGNWCGLMPVGSVLGNFQYGFTYTSNTTQLSDEMVNAINFFVAESVDSGELPSYTSTVFSYDRPQCALEDYVQSSQSAVGWTPVDVITLSGLAITVGAAVIVAVFFNVFEKTLLHVCLRLQGVHEGARRGAQPAAAAAGKEGGEIVGE